MGIRKFFGMSLLFLASTLVVMSADDRTPVPAKENITEAGKLIKDIFKTEYAKTKLADRIALANKLIEQAEDSKNEPASKYALLMEARDIAAKAGNAETAFRAADELATGFQVNPGEVRTAIADQLATTVSTVASATSATEQLLAAADHVKQVEDWDSNLKLAKAAEVASRKTQNAALANAAKARVKEAEMLVAEAAKLGTHLDKLKSTPDDPGANLALGRFYAFYKGDWTKGLPMLAKGSDEKLKEAAEKDQLAEEGDENFKLAAADAWYELIATADASLKPTFQIRAHRFYSDAVAKLTGLTKARAEKRIAELQVIVDARTDKSKLWTDIRKAVTANNLKKGEIIGGGFSQKTFEEIPKDGAILVGFIYTSKGNGQYPGAVQPLWLTPRGEVKGKGYGVVGKDHSAIMTTRAKKGYAVGAIYVRGGGGFDAFQPIYMKITDKGLDPKDSYKGPYIGGKGGGEGTVGGDGNFIVGIHGKLQDQGSMATISTVSLSPKK